MTQQRLRIYSGECEHGLCGTPTELIDCTGAPLFVGDIVSIAYSGRCGDVWHHGLSAVVAGRPALLGRADVPGAFVMGLLSVDINNDSAWVVTKVKSWEDVVVGERWVNYGFNYRANFPEAS